MDRFLMHVRVDYPPVEDEVEVIRLVRAEEATKQKVDSGEKAQKADKPPVIPQAAVFQARAEIADIQVSDQMERYMADLVYGTREPAKLSGDLGRWIEVGGSPRASLAFDKCGRAHAWLKGRDYVDPVDVRAVAHDVLRHRLTLSYEAQGEGVTADAVTDALLAQVAVP
jgi:MoxR-like ATPase